MSHAKEDDRIVRQQKVQFTELIHDSSYLLVQPQLHPGTTPQATFGFTGFSPLTTCPKEMRLHERFRMPLEKIRKYLGAMMANRLKLLNLLSP